MNWERPGATLLTVTNLGRTTITDGASLPAQHHAVWRRAAVLTLLTIALAVLASSDALHAALIEVLAASEVVIDHHPLLGALLFVLFAAVSAMFAFVSVAMFLPVAVFAWGEPFSILLLWLGWILGGACSYGVGRYLGRAVVRWLTAEGLLHRLERLVGPRSSFGLIMIFQLALPSEIPGYVLGLARYSFPKYLLALGLVELPYTVAMVHLGASFVERRAGVVLGVGIALVLFSVTAFYVLRKKLKKLS